MAQIYKLCKKCGDEKDIEEFSNSKTSKNGKKSYCKICDRLKERERYNSIKPERITQIKVWNSKNKQKLRAYKEKWTAKQKLLKENEIIL